METKAKSDGASAGIVDVAVLDDDQDFLQYMEDFLSDEGIYRVRTYTQPDDLLGSERPEVILLDMKMGPYSGAAELERIQDAWPGVCLGRQIKILRVERGWSLKELAAQTGISVSQLSSIERGAHMPSIDSLLLLCESLGTKPSALLAAIEF